MPRRQRDVEKALEKKGFRRRENDHRYFVYWSEDDKKSNAFTKTSHGSGIELSDSLLAEMARQCGLTRKKFLTLIDCPLSRKEYEGALREKEWL